MFAVYAQHVRGEMFGAKRHFLAWHVIGRLNGLAEDGRPLLDAVRGLLESPDDAVRCSVANSLAWFGEQPLLIESIAHSMLNDPSYDLQGGLVSAVRQMPAALERPDVLAWLAQIVSNGLDHAHSAIEALAQIKGTAQRAAVLPALIQAAESSLDAKVALVRLGESAVIVAPIVRAIESNSPPSSWVYGAHDLGFCEILGGQPSVVMALVQTALRDQTADVRNTALAALRRLGEDGSRQFSGLPETVKSIVQAALVEVLLGDDDEDNRMEAGRALMYAAWWEKKDPALLTVLCEALRYSAKPAVRCDAAHALGTYGLWGKFGAQPAAISSLLFAMANDAESMVRAEAAGALGWMYGDAVSRPEILAAWLRALLSDSAAAVRSRAAQSLGLLREAGVGPDLAAVMAGCLLKDRDESVRISIARAFKSIDGALAHSGVVSALLRVLDDESGYVRLEAVRTLGKPPHADQYPKVAKALVKSLLRDTYDQVRSTAADSIAQLGADVISRTDVWNALIVAMSRDESDLVQGTAAKALGTLGDGASQHVALALTDATVNSDKSSLREAALALGLLLEARLADPSSLGSHVWTEALDVLMRSAIGQGAENVQREARTAMERLTDLGLRVFESGDKYFARKTTDLAEIIAGF
jgi:HEAT repeat protein